MKKNYSNLKFYDYEGGRYIEVHDYSKYHNAYDCNVYPLYVDDDGDFYFSILNFRYVLLTQSDLDRIEKVYA